MNNSLYEMRGSLAKYRVQVSVLNDDCSTEECPACEALQQLDIRRLNFENHTAFCHDSQKKWPDILFTLDSSTIIAISEKVKNDMEREGVSGCKFHRLNLNELTWKKQPMPSFDYWLIEALEAVTERPIPDENYRHYKCQKCGTINQYKRFSISGKPPHYPLLSAMPEIPDFVRLKLRYHYGLLLCSERIVDMAGKYGWTSMSFENYSCALGSIDVYHKMPDWRERLKQDIARREAKLRGETPDVAEVIQIAISEMPKHDKATAPKPASDHPFDNLSAFDGTAWQGNAVIPCAFGFCDFVVYEDEDAEYDVDDNADYLPMKNQRKLFDFFVSRQEPLLPLLRDALVNTLRQSKILSDIDALSNCGEFSDLSQWLDGGGPEFGSAKRGGSGVVTLYYTVKKSDPIITITIEVACNPARDTVKIKSCEM